MAAIERLDDSPLIFQVHFDYLTINTLRGENDSSTVAIVDTVCCLAVSHLTFDATPKALDKIERLILDTVCTFRRKETSLLVKQQSHQLL